MYSPQGLRLKEGDPRYLMHEIYVQVRLARQEPVRIFENSALYPEGDLEKSFPTCEIHGAKVDPRNFGYPIARSRYYAIVLERERATWDCPITFHQVLQTLMARPKMSPEDTSEVFASRSASVFVSVYICIP
jgi:hypothetical protein